MSVKISEPMEEAIDTYARRRGQSKSSVVREAVEQYVVGKRRTGSFAEQAADFRGIVAGPSNLSADPGGLDGFGE